MNNDIRAYVCINSLPRLLRVIGEDILETPISPCPDWPQGDRRGIRCHIDILDPLSHVGAVRIPKLAICGPDDLHSYRSEILLGTADEARQKIGCYTYSDRMRQPIDQIKSSIDELKRNPDSNRAVITLGRPEDVLSQDLPCLRHIQFKTIDEGLAMTAIWRSRDFVQAWYMNVYGLVSLGDYVANCLNIPFYRYSEYNENLHAYASCWTALESFINLPDNDEDLVVDFDDLLEDS